MAPDKGELEDTIQKVNDSRKGDRVLNSKKERECREE
jgi:hypothetical protein